jgi:hypothetical protein
MLIDIRNVHCGEVSGWDFDDKHNAFIDHFWVDYNIAMYANIKQIGRGWGIAIEFLYIAQ